MEKKKSDVQLDEILKLSKETLKALYDFLKFLIQEKELHPDENTILISQTYDNLSYQTESVRDFWRDFEENRAFLRYLEKSGILTYGKELTTHSSVICDYYAFGVTIKDIGKLKFVGEEIEHRLEVIESKDKKVDIAEQTNRKIVPISTDEGITWEQISMNLDDYHTVTIKIGTNFREKIDYKQLGFADTTKKEHPPKEAWKQFTALFYKDGFLKFPERKERTVVKRDEEEDEEDKQKVYEDLDEEEQDLNEKTEEDKENNVEEENDGITRQDYGQFPRKKESREKEIVKQRKKEIKDMLQAMFPKVLDDPFETIPREGYQLKIKLTIFA